MGFFNKSIQKYESSVIDDMDIPLINKLAEQGVVALMLAISVLGNIWQYKQYMNIQEKRLGDVMEARDMLMEPVKSIGKTVDLILSMLQTQK